MDPINSIFEIIGGIMIINNCYVLFKHKDVKGVSIFTSFFFTIWSYWNIFYYLQLSQPISFIAGILLAIANSVWTGLAVYFVGKKKEIDSEVIF